MSPPQHRSSRRWRTETQLESLRGGGAERADRVDFAVIGDAEPGRFLWSRLLFGTPGAFHSQLAGIRAEPVDLVIQLGDMVSRGLPGHYAEFLDELDRHRPGRPYFTVLGNHDRRSPHGHSDASEYRAAFGEPNYFFDRGPARFIILDTSEEGLRDSQRRWLNHALDTDRIKLVFMHKPPAGLAPWVAGRFGGFVKGSDAMMRLFSRRGVARVYMGHVHGFAQARVDGVTYVLTGGGGSPLYPSLVPHRFHHYLVVSAGPDGVSETLQKLGGERLALDPCRPLARRRPSRLLARTSFQAPLKYLSAALPLALISARLF